MKYSKKKKVKILLVTHSLEQGGAEIIAKTIADLVSQTKFEARVLVIHGRARRTNFKIPVYFACKQNKMEFGLMLRIKRILNEFKPHIIHNHSLVALPYLLIANKISSKSIIIHTNHSNLDHYLLLIRLMVNFSGIYTADLSENLNRTINRKRRFVVANGISEKFFIATPPPRKNKTILNIARMEKPKNHELLLEAFSLIVRQDKEFRLILVGTGSKLEKIKKLAEKLKLQNKIKFVASTKNSVNYYDKATYYLNTSLWEGMPLVILEAMARGLVVFSTPAGSIPNILQDQKEGFLIDYNPSNICTKFFASLGSSELRSIQANAINRAKKYNALTMVRKYEKIYQKIKNG